MFPSADAAIKAWNSGKLRIPKADRWQSLQFAVGGKALPYGDNSSHRGKGRIERNGDSTNTQVMVPGVLLWVGTVEEDGHEELEAVVGFEGRLRRPGPPEGLDRERFTALFRIGNGLEGHAEIFNFGRIQMDAGGVTLECRIVFADSRGSDVLAGLRGQEGSNVLVLLDLRFLGKWKRPPDPGMDRARKAAARYNLGFHQWAFDQFWRGTTGSYPHDPVGKARRPASIDALPGSVPASKLPMIVTFILQPRS